MYAVVIGGRNIMRFDVVVKRGILTLLSLVCMASVLANEAYAKDTTASVAGMLYEFGKNDHYEWGEAAGSATSQSNTIGALTIRGDVRANGTEGGVPAYVVNSDDLSIFYTLNSAVLARPETEWRLTDNKTKKVNGLTLENNILSGAIIIQSSRDREYWSTEEPLLNAFTGSNEQLAEALCTSKAIQLQNGCYYRVTVAYKMQRKLEDKKILFINADNYEEKELAEVYEFYAVSSESLKSKLTPNDAPRKELGGMIKTEKDKGYSGEVAVDKNDPHFGWDLGTFVINGYTSETSKDGIPVFLKNVGDKVTLWFVLGQDINSLNGNGALSIAEDTNGYDQQFGVPQTNFKHGTLIIRYTDHEGHTGDPVIYTDFLAANARTSADTKVQLFEEGDYEVTLNYEIKNDPRKVGPVSIVPTYTDYKISFQFKIRNGNSMVFPLDIGTGVELGDQAITENGFRLDMAKSRYLKINVERATVKTNAEGFVAKDVRFNRPVKDNEMYQDEGIYTFTVTNDYTGNSTTKTVYVGSNKYVMALAKYKLSVDALNERIGQGAVVEGDGTITAPTPVSEPLPEPAESTENESLIQIQAPDKTAEEAFAPSTEPSNTPDNVSSSEPEPLEEDTGSAAPIIFAGVSVLAASVVLVLVKKRSKKEEEVDAK